MAKKKTAKKAAKTAKKAAPKTTAKKTAKKTTAKKVAKKTTEKKVAKKTTAKKVSKKTTAKKETKKVAKKVEKKVAKKVAKKETKKVEKKVAKKAEKKVAKKAAAKKVAKKETKKIEKKVAKKATKAVEKKVRTEDKKPKKEKKSNKEETKVAKKAANEDEDLILLDDDQDIDEPTQEELFKVPTKKASEQIKEELADEVTRLSEDYSIADIFSSLQLSDFFASSSDDCIEKGCDNPATTLGFCRFHYIKNWKEIKRKQQILTEGKLQLFIEDLVSKYPIKNVESVLSDLADEKSFYGILQELNIESDDSDYYDSGEEEDDDDDIAFETKVTKAEYGDE